VGEAAECTASLLLPRATAAGGVVRVRLCNLAQEIEYLDEARLGAVRLARDEELDVGNDGRPFVWLPSRGLRTEGAVPAESRLPANAPNRVLGLEVRNTSSFEASMRNWLLDGGPSVAGSLTVRFDEGPDQVVWPVGTKFLRRVVVPVPAEARRATFNLSESYWLLRRAWIGTGRCEE